MLLCIIFTKSKKIFTNKNPTNTKMIDVEVYFKTQHENINDPKQISFQ